MATTFTLQPADESHAATIRKMVIGARLNPADLDWRHFIVALTPEGEVIGCGQVKSHRDGSRELASMVVHRVYRRRGIARAIIEKLVAENPPPLYLMCRSKLGPFYEKFGFRAITVDEMPRYFQRISKLAALADLLSHGGETLLVMKRE
ncbi:MAG: GNAT family N-acetyltransferase [Chloroflexota bacterium]